MQVHFDTYRQEADYVYTRNGVEQRAAQFSVEITISNGRKDDRRRVSCSSVYSGWVCIRDLALRFSQGAKVWPGTATYWVESGVVNNVRPNIDKRGHVFLVGFFEDFDGKKVASQHNAVA